MCIIAAKPAGVAMPDSNTIETMWYNNSDGAGFMYAKDGLVHVSKGYMKLKEFTKALSKLGDDLTDTSLVMHFRIATHGGIVPSNTHPFPVTSSIGVLQKLKSTAKLGVAHNGIIHSVTPRKGISDTMEYVATQLAPLYKGAPKFYTNPHLMEMVDNAVGGKLAFLTGAGDIYTVGHFEEEKGLLYSNTSYRSKIIYTKWDAPLKNWSEYDYLDDDYDDYVEGYRYKGHRVVKMIDGSNGEYVVDPAGRWADPSEYDVCVDVDGKVYTYEVGVDGVILWYGARVYTDKGKQVYAEANSSDPMTYMENIYEEVYVGEKITDNSNIIWKKGGTD